MDIVSEMKCRLIPITKKEVDEYKILVSQMSLFCEDKKRISFSENFPPHLAGIIGGVGSGIVGVGAVFTYFAGMSGAEIMSALASFGVAGAAGGIASISAVILAPVALIGGGMYCVANQRKLSRELKRLFKLSIGFENELKNDERENVKGLLVTTKECRMKLINKHHKLRE